MTTYERVTYRPETDGKPQRARSVFLENPTESSLAVPNHDRVATLVGRQVGKDGESTWDHGDRTHIIQQALIVKREPYEMDVFYGELVPAGTAKVTVGASDEEVKRILDTFFGPEAPANRDD